MIAYIDDPRQRRRENYPVVRATPLRWADVDTYGHVNNIVHYALMDTAINSWLGEATGKDVRAGSAIGLVAETGCRYFRELHFPNPVDVGLRVESVGTSSVRYEVGFFVDEGEPVAVASFVHVYVHPQSRRPTAIPADVRDALTTLAAGTEPENQT